LLVGKKGREGKLEAGPPDGKKPRRRDEKISWWRGENGSEV